jgi:pyruvate ferredoxin oxidoreductase beta subunit
MSIKLKDVSTVEHLSLGNLACAGCPEMIAMRHALKVLGSNTIVINATSCSAVITQMGVPKVPHFHVLLENAPAVVSGIDDALKVMGRRDGVHLLAIAGDGGTADIGLSSLSAAIERDQDFIYLCVDNESYMNTGGQRSGTTPFGAKTSTTPRGEVRLPTLRKDMVEIIAAHNIPYAASASVAYPLDLMAKIEKAAAVRGPSYVHCHVPCPTGWGFEPADTVNVARLAVKSGCVVLYEFENGVRRRTGGVKNLQPVEEYLRHQARFAHVIDDASAVDAIQQAVRERYDALMARMA